MHGAVTLPTFPSPEWDQRFREVTQLVSEGICPVCRTPLDRCWDKHEKREIGFCPKAQSPARDYYVWVRRNPKTGELELCEAFIRETTLTALGPADETRADSETEGGTA